MNHFQIPPPPWCFENVSLRVIFKVVGLFVGYVIRYTSVNNSALHVWRERRVVFTSDFVCDELLEREFFTCKEWETLIWQIYS